MSSFYLDIIKDRLYASKKDDKKRRSAQTAMYEILSDLIVMLAPILSFTMEEVYQFMKKPAGAPESVLMLEWPKLHEEYLDKAKMENGNTSLLFAAKSRRSLKMHAGKRPSATPLMPRSTFMPRVKLMSS